MVEKSLDQTNEPIKTPHEFSFIVKTTKSIVKDKSLLELGLTRPQSKSQERLKRTNLYQKTQNELINKLNIDLGGTTSNDITTSNINKSINSNLSRNIPIKRILQDVSSTREFKSIPRSPEKNNAQAESLSAGFRATRVNKNFNNNLNLTSTRNLNRTNINLRDSFDYNQKQGAFANMSSTKKKRISNANNGNDMNENDFRQMRDKTPKLRNQGISLTNQGLKFKLDLTTYNKISYNVIN